MLQKWQTNRETWRWLHWKGAVRYATDVSTGVPNTSNAGRWDDKKTERCISYYCSSFLFGEGHNAVFFPPASLVLWLITDTCRTLRRILPIVGRQVSIVLEIGGGMHGGTSGKVIACCSSIVCSDNVKYCVTCCSITHRFVRYIRCGLQTLL
jgi:hypothetical protein